MDSITTPLNPSTHRSRRLTITNMQPQPKNAQQLPPHALAFIFAVSWFIYSLLFQGLITLAPAVKGRYITEAAAHKRGEVSLNEEDISKARSTRQSRTRVVQVPALTSRPPASKKHVSFHNIAPIDVEYARAGSPVRERADSPVAARPRFSLSRPLLRRLSVVPEADGDESDSGKRTVMFSVSSPTATMSSVFSKCDKTERRKSEDAAGRELFVQATISSAGSTRTSTCSDASTCTSISSEPVSPDSERSSFSFAPCKTSSASLMKRVNHRLTSPWKVTKAALHDVPSAPVSLRTRTLQTANKSGVSRPSSFTPAILASLGMAPKRTLERTDPYAAPYNAPLPRYKHSSLGSASRSRSGTPARARSFSVDAGQLRERLSALQL